MIAKRNFYERNTVKVAKDILGCFLVREYKGKITKAMIMETEAYRGEYDLASHASKGRTKRTEIMYGQPGHAYIYMIYGMYFMLNVVTEEKDFPAAVLIRGISVGAIHELPNGRSVHEPPLQINGPGKLTKFLHIDKTFNGYDLTRGEKLWIELGHPMSKKFKIIKSPRVGIDYARHCREWKWNFKLVDK
jgi:DNA-3-methyladenine glycosylase